jgi:hypothetical protein
VQGRLGEEAVGRRDAQDAAECCSGAEEDDIPGEAAGFPRAVAVDCADYGGDFVVEEEEDGYY